MVGVDSHFADSGFCIHHCNLFSFSAGPFLSVQYTTANSFSSHLEEPALCHHVPRVRLLTCSFIPSSPGPKSVEETRMLDSWRK